MFIIIKIWACNKLSFFLFWEWACWFNPIRMVADGADEDAAAAFFQIVMCWQSIIFGFNVIWSLCLVLLLRTKVHLTPCAVFFLTLFKRCMARMMLCCCSAFRFLYLIIFHSLTSIRDFYFNLKKCNAYSVFFCVLIMCAEAATTAIAVAPILVEETLPLPPLLTSWTVNFFLSSFFSYAIISFFLHNAPKIN